MSATYQIKGKRFQRLYTASSPTPTYAASADATTIANTMCTLPWTPVQTDVIPCFPAHPGNDKTDQANVSNRNNFDAAMFCSDHDKDSGTHIARAQVTCYRFTLPSVGIVLQSINVGVSCDPYNAGGARIAVFTNNTGVVPEACQACRQGSSPSQNHSCTKSGDVWTSNDTYADGVAPRTTGTDNMWYSGLGSADLVPEGGLTLGRFLFVFVHLENYVSRSGYLEGSAFIQSPVTLVTSAAVPSWSGISGVIDLGQDDPAAVGFTGFQIMKGGSAPEYDIKDRFSLIGRSPFTGVKLAESEKVRLSNIDRHGEFAWDSDDDSTSQDIFGWPINSKVFGDADVVGHSPFVNHYIVGIDFGGFVVTYNKSEASTFTASDAEPAFKVPGLRFFYAATGATQLDDPDGPPPYHLYELDYLMSTMNSDPSSIPDFVRWMKDGQVTRLFIVPAFSHGSARYQSGETRGTRDKVAFALIVTNGVLRTSVVAGYFVACNCDLTVSSYDEHTSAEMGNTHWRFFRSNRTGVAFPGSVVAVFSELQYYMADANTTIDIGHIGTMAPFPQRSLNSEVQFTEVVRTSQSSSGEIITDVDFHIDIKSSSYVLENYTSIVVEHLVGENEVEYRCPNILAPFRVKGKNILARAPGDDVPGMGIPYFSNSVLVITGDLESVDDNTCSQIAYVDVNSGFGTSTPVTVYVPGLDGDIPVESGTPFNVFFYPLRYTGYIRGRGPTPDPSIDWKWRPRNGVITTTTWLGFLEMNTCYAIVTTKTPMTIGGTTTNTAWATFYSGLGSPAISTSFTVNGVPQSMRDTFLDWLMWTPVAKGWYSHFTTADQPVLDVVEVDDPRGMYSNATGSSAYSRDGACIGLRNCYADFFDSSDSEEGNLIPSSTSAVVCSLRAFQNHRIVTSDRGLTRRMIDVPEWELAVSPLLVPFSSPTVSYNATKLKLEWNTTGITSGIKFAVWLMRGKRITSYIEDLRDRGFYCADSTKIRGWERVGIVDGVSGEAILPLETPLKSRVGTLLLTAWVQQDYINPSDVISAGTTSVEYSKGVGSVGNPDVVTGKSPVIQSTGWRPAIYLLP